MRKIDLTGKVFGRLTVLNFAGRDKCGRARWLCHCSYGGEKVIDGYNLTRGATSSCGCFSIELTKKRNTTHGESNKNLTPEFETWNKIKQRCYNKNTKKYAIYGGRGITVCEEWLKSYKNFLADMGRRPSSNYSIDRIDNNKGYSPKNCRWATATEQNNNRRNTIRLKFYSLNLTLSEWSRLLNIRYDVLRWRLNRGWSTYKILITPMKEQKRKAIYA